LVLWANVCPADRKTSVQGRVESNSKKVFKLSNGLGSKDSNSAKALLEQMEQLVAFENEHKAASTVTRV